MIRSFSYSASWALRHSMPASHSMTVRQEVEFGPPYRWDLPEFRENGNEIGSWVVGRSNLFVSQCQIRLRRASTYSSKFGKTLDESLSHISSSSLVQFLLTSADCLRIGCCPCVHIFIAPSSSCHAMHAIVPCEPFFVVGSAWGGWNLNPTSCNHCLTLRFIHWWFWKSSMHLSKGTPNQNGHGDWCCRWVGQWRNCMQKLLSWSSTSHAGLHTDGYDLWALVAYPQTDSSNHHPLACLTDVEDVSILGATRNLLCLSIW